MGFTRHHVVCQFSQQQRGDAEGRITGVLLFAVQSARGVAPGRERHIPTILHAHEWQSGATQLQYYQNQFGRRPLIQEQREELGHTGWLAQDGLADVTPW